MQLLAAPESCARSLLYITRGEGQGRQEWGRGEGTKGFGGIRGGLVGPWGGPSQGGRVWGVKNSPEGLGLAQPQGWGKWLGFLSLQGCAAKACRCSRDWVSLS